MHCNHFDSVCCKPPLLTYTVSRSCRYVVLPSYAETKCNSGRRKSIPFSVDFLCVLWIPTSQECCNVWNVYLYQCCERLWTDTLRRGRSLYFTSSTHWCHSWHFGHVFRVKCLPGSVHSLLISSNYSLTLFDVYGSVISLRALIQSHVPQDPDERTKIVKIIHLRKSEVTIIFLILLCQGNEFQR